MYGHRARETIIAILKECPELKVGEPPTSVVKTTGYRQMADRLIIELWMRGFAVSARKVGAKPPSGAPDQKAWRDETLAKPKGRGASRRRRESASPPDQTPQAAE